MSWLEVKAKREQEAKLVHDAREILERAKAEKRDMTPDEQVQFDKMHEDAFKANKDARSLETQVQAERAVSNHFGREDVDSNPVETRAVDKKAAFKRYMQYGPDQTRAMSVGTANQGAELMPEEMHDEFYRVMSWFGGVRESGATVWNTSTGVPIPFPKLDDTANTGELVAENVDPNDAGADPATSEVVFNSFIFDSKVVRLSWKAVRDAAWEPGQWLIPELVTRVARRQNYFLTVGSGSSQPQGVVTGAALGKTAASSAAITYNEILDLIYSVNKAYRTKDCKLMFSDATELAIRKLVDADGNPIWHHGNPATGVFDNVAGYGYVVNNDMANIGVGNKSVLFGNFNRGYVIRDVGRIQVATEVLNLDFQNAYVAYHECDGRVVDSGCIKYLVHPST